jgi:O-antigen/teichoic acid export membrane protein
MRSGVEARAFSAGVGKLSWDLGSRVLSFVLSVLVARKLGVEGFGIYAVYWYAAWMAAQATDLGIHLVLLRSLSRSFEPRVFWSAALAKGILSGCVILATGAVLATRALSVDAAVLLGLLAAQLVSSWVELLGVTLRSRGGIAREGLSLIVLRFASLAAALWALARGSDLTVLAAALAVSGVPALVLALGLLPRLPLQGPIEAGRLLKEALPLGLVSALTLLYLRADLFIVAAFAGPSEAGTFQSAFRLFEAAFVVSGGLAAGTFPMLAARFGEKGFDALARFVLAILALASAPIVFAFALSPRPLLGLVYGEDFAEAARTLSLLGVALVAVFANALTTHLLVASGRTRHLIGSIAVRLGVGVALDIALVPRWGAAGAAVAVIAAEWSLLATSLASCWDLLGLSSLSRAPREEASSCS